MNGALRSFALPAEVYVEDVRQIMADTIQLYGEDEWRKVVLTNELHGHLGIYSTLGAKMGCFALEHLREALGAEPEEPRVLSFAGTTPPVSCLNDGIQVSTGATVGHGLIAISEEEEKRVEAIFSQGDVSLHIRLKTSYQTKISEDIRAGVRRYAHTPAYWQYIRSLAICYWRDWNRAHIFEIIH